MTILQNLNILLSRRDYAYGIPTTRLFNNIEIYHIHVISDAPPSNDFSKRNLIHIFDTLYTTITEFGVGRRTGLPRTRPLYAVHRTLYHIFTIKFIAFNRC